VKITEMSKEFYNKNMMGPNAVKIAQELTSHMNIQPGMRVLDLGCGTGMTSIYLAQTYGVEVYATDLWISATDNYERIKEFGLENQITPIHANAYDLPYANDYFDVIISIDSFHYYGTKENFIKESLMPLLKESGQIGIASPGLKEEFENGVPEHLLPFWEDDMIFHSCKWWEDLFNRETTPKSMKSFEVKCHDDAWDDWNNSGHEYATDDGFLDAIGDNFNTVAIIVEK
jgi:cyclopropane fatty-acyl-phospholipid synthase-like methyltransferase